MLHAALSKLIITAKSITQIARRLPKPYTARAVVSTKNIVSVAIRPRRWECTQTPTDTLAQKHNRHIIYRPGSVGLVHRTFGFYFEARLVLGWATA